MTRSLLLSILSFLLLGINGFSQNCAVKLRDAEAMFNAGKVEEVPAVLAPCLASGFTKAEELTAYQLIIRAYQFDDEVDKAEETMLQFLRKNPEYELKQTDNPDFVYLYKQFKVSPLLKVGISGGVVSTFLSGITSNTTTGLPSGGKYSNDKFSFSGGLEALIQVSPRLEIGAGVDFTQASFMYKGKYQEYAMMYYTENENRIETPVNLYFFPKAYGRFHPYIKGGGGLSLNISTNSEAWQENIDVNNTIARLPGQETRTDLRQKLDPFISGGLGCRFKIPMSYIFAEINTRMGTQIQSKASVPGDMEYYYGFTDDIYRLNTVRLNIGFIYIIYKPSKKEN